MDQIIRAASALQGDLTIPADKSIAHRAALLSALADGPSHIVNYPRAADPRSTLACIRALGIQVDEEDDMLTIHGRGLHGFRAPDADLDCENSGTTMRLLTGVLAGQPFDSTLTGDESLRKRPMGRIADPLRTMGAALDLTEGKPPIHIHGGQTLSPIAYALPVASAQVKSCVLLAGLYADGETTVIETLPSRDHTERMMGLPIFDDGTRRHISVQGGMVIEPRTWAVPGDFSAAAFFLVAGSIVPDAKLMLRGVGLNPSRSAFLNVLQAMGADITVKNERELGGEPIADLVVRSADLHGVSVGGDIMPNLIDEVPALAVAAACAAGRTEVRDAAELRVKESDRIHTVVESLSALGCDVEELEDGFVITGRSDMRGTVLESHGDHRIAMAMAVAGLVAEGETRIVGADCASVSFPGFWDTLEAIAVTASREAEG